MPPLPLLHRTLGARFSLRLLAALAVSSSLPAQVLVRGTVKDTLGNPIGNAEIRAHGLPARAMSNDSGHFSFGDMPPGPRVFDVRRLGFQPIAFDVVIPPAGSKTFDMDIELDPAIAQLEGVEIRRAPPPDLRSTGFFDRKSKYAGATFISPADIERRHATFASQILESTHNVSLRGPVGRKRVVQRNTNCDVAIFVDRRFMRSGRDARGVDWGVFDELVDASDIYAVEIHSHTPPDFQVPAFAGQKFCGAVIIWTRLYRVGTGR